MNYPDNPLGKQISDLSKDTKKLIKHLLNTPLIGDGQFGILHEIWRNQGCSQEYLSKCRGLDKATIAKSIKKLITNGYIYKEKDKLDQRACCLYLTEKGNDFIPKIQETIRLEEITLTKNLTDEEIIFFKSILNKITVNIEEYFEEEDK